MEENRHKQELLEKYLKGKCSLEELSQLHHYLLTSEDDEAYGEVMDQLWEQIQQDRVLVDQKAEKILDNVFRRSGSRRSFPMHWYRVAAVFTGFMLLAGILYLLIVKEENPVRYATDYGETRTVLLPDSSRVTLNANSSLTFRMDQQNIRELWLQGEAFFEVRKMKTSTPSPEAVKFLVHTGNLNVEVLGTSFNVNDRRGTTQVVLMSGKIRLETKYKEQLTLQPGDMAELSAQTASLKKQIVNPDDYIVWRENKLVFKETPMKEVARIIEDYYGFDVRLAGEGWDDRKITGSIPTGRQDLFLEVLAESMEVSITQNGNHIVLENNSRSSP